MPKISFTITLKPPPRASRADILNYILDAVATWRGQLRPPGALDDDDLGDPMWDLDPNSINISCQQRRKK